MPKFLIDKKFGAKEELIELFSDIEGITLQWCEDWSTSSHFCFSSEDPNLLPIISSGHFMVGNDRIDVEPCPILYASTDAGDELDAAVVIRVVLRISQVPLTSMESSSPKNLKCLVFSCPPQLIPLVCSTEYKVQGKIVTFSTRTGVRVRMASPKTIASEEQPKPAPTANHQTSSPPMTSHSPHSYPQYPGPFPPNYPPHLFYPHQYPHQYPFPYPYGPMATDVFPPPSSSANNNMSHHSETAVAAPAPVPPPLPPSLPQSLPTALPPAQRPLYSIELFHDGENCPCTASLNAVTVFETTIRLIISRFLGDSFQNDKFDIYASAQVKWNFVLSPDKISSSLSKFLADLETLGATRIDPGTKSDAVDTSIKKLMDQYRADYAARSVESNKNRIAVLISGDRDFAESLKALRLTGANVMLIYNSENASRALRAIVPSDYVLGSWLSLVRGIRDDPADAKTDSSSPKASSSSALTNGSGGGSSKPFCSWCHARRGETLYHDEKNCPNKPSKECRWCRQMLGRSFVHRSVCPNNLTIVSKYKGHPSECVCIWCLKNGFRSLAHRYVHCRNKPLGTHHCPYCYRVCGLVDFHTIYVCKNTPSLAEYSVGGSSSKKNPHVNEMSLKDQIFHLEIKIVKCQETIMGCNVKAEENGLRAKLHNLYKTEETLVNQLRMLELKTLSKAAPSASSVSSSTSAAPPSSSSSLPSSSKAFSSSSNTNAPHSSSSAASSGLGHGTGAGTGSGGGGAGGDIEKYQTLFENDLLFGEMEEIAYDESEGYDEDGAQQGVGEREGRRETAAALTGRHSPSSSSRKRKHLEQEALMESSVSAKHQRLLDDDKESTDSGGSLTQQVDEIIKATEKAAKRKKKKSARNENPSPPTALSLALTPFNSSSALAPAPVSPSAASTSSGTSSFQDPSSSSVYWKIDRHPG